MKDPVCGMEVDPKTTRYSMEYKGKTYYFCSEKCLNDFSSNPERYLGESHQSNSHGGMGGCCGGGGKMGYLHLILMIFLVIVYVARTLWG